MDDHRSNPNNVSLGTDFGTRNTLGVINASFYTWTNWDGRFDSQWSLPLAVAENAKIMNSTRLAVAHMLFAKYRTEYDTVFAVALDPDLDPAATNASRFPATGKPGQAGYDAMAAGDKLITDNQFHALGVPQTGPHVPVTDNGRFQDVPALLASAFNVNGAFSDDANTGKLTGLAQDPSMTGQFRTKSLRNIAGAGPYMHAGQLATLADVIELYDVGGGETGSSGITKDTRLIPLGLSAGDKTDLVAFLLTLSGEPLPAAVVVDTSK